MRYYAGIGSRQVPTHIYHKMYETAVYLGTRHWGLRSGGAGGSDEAFERGCIRVKGYKEIYLPWKGFNSNEALYYRPSDKAKEMVDVFHPAPDKLTPGARKMMERNYCQVFGRSLFYEIPISMCVCYTDGGALNGGTSHALRLIAAMLPNTLVVNYGKLGAHLIEPQHLGNNFWCNQKKCEGRLLTALDKDCSACGSCGDLLVSPEVSRILRLHNEMIFHYRNDRKVKAYLESL